MGTSPQLLRSKDEKFTKIRSGFTPPWLATASVMGAMMEANVPPMDSTFMTAAGSVEPPKRRVELWSTCTATYISGLPNPAAASWLKAAAIFPAAAWSPLYTHFTNGILLTG